MVARWYRWYEVLSSVFIFFYVPLAINLESSLSLSASKTFYSIICTGDISSQNLIFYCSTYHLLVTERFESRARFQIGFLSIERSPNFLNQTLIFWNKIIYINSMPKFNEKLAFKVTGSQYFWPRSLLYWGVRIQSVTGCIERRIASLTKFMTD